MMDFDKGGPWTQVTTQAGEDMKEGDKVRQFQARGQWWARKARWYEEPHGTLKHDAEPGDILSIVLHGELEDPRLGFHDFIFHFSSLVIGLSVGRSIVELFL